MTRILKSFKTNTAARGRWYRVALDRYVYGRDNADQAQRRYSDGNEGLPLSEFGADEILDPEYADEPTPAAPQTPEPDDLVEIRVTAVHSETTARGQRIVTIFSDNGRRHVVTLPTDAEITVLERATPTPAAPEEPDVGAVRMTGDPDVTFVHRYDEICGWTTTRGSAKYSWAELNRDYTLYDVERGAVIGGE